MSDQAASPLPGPSGLALHSWRAPLAGVTVPVPATEARTVPAVVDRLVIPAALYLMALVPLLWKLGTHPEFAYNWEAYTFRGFFQYWDGERPWSDLLLLTDGVMTDSGETPLVMLPVWFSFKLFGVSLVTARLPIALLASLAVPLLWAVARPIAGRRPAALAAALLAFSPVFMLYGRTGTNVGLSIAPALATIYVLLRVVQVPSSSRARWGWLLALQLLLILDVYAYAVIRFMWPMALGLIFLELVLRWRHWRYFLAAFAVTAVVLPVYLNLIDLAPSAGWAGGPGERVIGYYNARSETIPDLADHPEHLRSFLVPTEEEIAAGRRPGEGLTTAELALRLIRQNARDYFNLLIDRNTRTAYLNHWHPSGRLYFWYLVPFFVIGLALCAWRMLRRPEDRLLMGLFWGFGLPMVLTTQVHIGRLIFVLPLLFILVAMGFWVTSRLIANLLTRWGSEGRSPQHQALLVDRVRLVLAVALVLVVINSAAVDYRGYPLLSRDVEISDLLRNHLPEALAAGGVAMVLGDLESARSDAGLELVIFSPVRVRLNGQYRFINLAAEPPDLSPPSAPDDLRPPVYVGGLLTLVSTPEAIPNFCGNLYLVDPPLEEEFLADTNNGWPLTCPAPLNWKLLPAWKRR